MTRVLLLTPPMTDPNSPYPATAYLCGFLRSRGIAATQADLSIELACRIFSAAFLRRLRDTISQQTAESAAPLHPAVEGFLESFSDYERTVEPVLRFLQGRDPALAHRIASRRFCPEGPRFVQLLARRDSLTRGFGRLGTHGRAKHLGALYLSDLVDVIRTTVDEDFRLATYKRTLAIHGADFQTLEERLARPPSLIDRELRALIAPHLEGGAPTLVGITVPSEGCVYGAFRCAQLVRDLLPSVPIALGGGFVNTELRSLEDPRVFDYVDFIVLDAGERPLLALLEHLAGHRQRRGLHRTFVRREGRVEYLVQPTEQEVPQKDTGFPTYDGLPLEQYFSFVSALNPIDNIWYDLRWHKLTLAHGCYWRQCTFCDVHLDYIQRYDASPVELIVDRMERIRDETGQSGFHFVDEAAPPALLKKLSARLLERDVCATWWTNIRFEKAFTPEVVELMARAGCVAISGGLEVASNRLLELMKKGVTVEQVARVARTFTSAGVTVHAYLIYGFPTQTEQETVDSLDLVRQLFAEECIQSGYWHRFSPTVHSPIGADPEAYGLKLHSPGGGGFARYAVPYEDATGTDHERLGEGLTRALACYAQGDGLEEDVRTWFTHRVPPPSVPDDFIARALAELPPAPEAGGGRWPNRDWRPAAPAEAMPANGFEIPDHVWYRQRSGATFVLNLNDGELFALQGIGERIWELLLEGRSRGQIAGTLTAEYAAPRERIDGDLAVLVDHLVRRDLVRAT